MCSWMWQFFGGLFHIFCFPMVARINAQTFAIPNSSILLSGLSSDCSSHPPPPTSGCRLQQQQQQQPHILKIPVQYLEVEIITRSTTLRRVILMPESRWMFTRRAQSLLQREQKQQLSQSASPGGIPCSRRRLTLNQKPLFPPFFSFGFFFFFLTK